MHQRKGKKILIFFFLLLLVGSINNISLNNLKFREINNINVSGLGDNSNAIILEKIKKLNLENIFLINRKKIANQIDTNSIVENYVVFKRYPSSLNVNISWKFDNIPAEIAVIPIKALTTGAFDM